MLDLLSVMERQNKKENLKLFSLFLISNLAPDWELRNQ
jgi:hypothetical protein